MLCEALLFGALNAVKHLDFEIGFRDSLLRNEITDAANDGNVVGAEGGARTLSSSLRDQASAEPRRNNFRPRRTFSEKAIFAGSL